MFFLISTVLALCVGTPAPAEPQITSTLTITSTLKHPLTLQSSSCTGCVFLANPPSSIVPGSTVKSRFEVLPGFSVGTAKVGYGGSGESVAVAIEQFQIGATPTVSFKCEPQHCTCTAGTARNTTCTI
uniref:Uncharacterized protein n=1 Tax=Sexangularia sp. CB-2014 TaxID=1486929 RepID=A0A7S1VK77_9EUKA